MLAGTAFGYRNRHWFAAVPTATIVLRQLFQAWEAQQLPAGCGIQAQQTLTREQVLLYIL
jgi:hypothetical protein